MARFYVERVALENLLAVTCPMHVEQNEQGGKAVNAIVFVQPTIHQEKNFSAKIIAVFEEESVDGEQKKNSIHEMEYADFIKYIGMSGVANRMLYIQEESLFLP